MTSANTNDGGFSQGRLTADGRLPASLFSSQPVLPAYIEYAFYVALAYDTLGSAILPIEIPMLGGGSLLFLAAICLTRARLRTSTIYASIVIPVGCFIAYTLMQLVVHGESLSSVRPFITWILLVIITHCLCLRPGFFRRFALVTLVIGLVAIPQLVFNPHDAQVERAKIEEISALGDANSLGEWFGFLVVYFLVHGLEAKRQKITIVSWIIALACLSVIGLTVSRGTLVGVAMATVVASRRLLSRGFFPVLLLVMLGAGAFESGLFERSISSYTSRGMEETGRFLVWPLAFQDFLDSPVVGVGASNTAIPVFSADPNNVITPHNGFLFVALASGIIPLIFLAAYWWRAGKGVICSSVDQSVDAPFLSALFIYGFIITQFGNGTFMRPFIVATLASATTASLCRRAHRGTTYQIRAVTDRFGTVRSKLDTNPLHTSMSKTIKPERD
jgi:O-antigen ligase